VGLWQVLRTGGDAENIAHVEHLTKYAAGKLILVRETFPDYTLHDRQHAENVIALIEQLLGPDIEKLRPLEAAMLILAAYFHDIGMVYQPEELAALGDDEDFRAFLDENPSAYVRVHEEAEIPRDIVVQYCRARHAKRVSTHLFQFESDELLWSGAGIASQLALLCRSHNEPLETLRSDDFRTNLLTECDLRMCAILLRLADILDLDDTRSPIAVYDHLRLAKAEGPRMVSDTEWTKHMASCGFRFPAERAPNYLLAFLASPRHPTVENAIRKFLDVVEYELHGCRILLDFCDPRWRPLPLPGSVDRSNITSIGYRSGEYRFSLDRQALLRLFMGEQLYSDPYVFIRELLQNAVDACRLNVYLHDVPQDHMEVRISAWEDEVGFYWFRVDDTGIGMDQEIVEKYFLGVGRSYYRSPELQADLLRKDKPKQKFVAISQFGIGVLSSFIVGDRIEVSTRRRLPDGTLATPLRLSLDSLDDYFVMQADPNRPSPFPGRTSWEEGYRRNPGTSVAVRVDPAKSDVALTNFLQRTREYLHFPPTRVFINDAEQPDRALVQLDTPLIPAPIRHQVSRETRSDHPVNLLVTGELSVSAIPLDLTAHSPTKAIRGQLLLVEAEASGSTSLVPALPTELQREVPASLRRGLSDCIVGRSASVSTASDGDGLWVALRLECRLEVIKKLRDWLTGRPYGPDGFYRGNLADTDLSEIFKDPRLDEAEGKLSSKTVTVSDIYYVRHFISSRDMSAGLLAPEWLGHNGIRVPIRLDAALSPGRPRLSLLPDDGRIITGAVCLFDELRPEVSVSRDILRGLPFQIRSALQLAVRRAASVHLDSPVGSVAEKVMEHDLFGLLPLREVAAVEIESDPLADEWCDEPVIWRNPDGYCSIAQLRARAATDRINLRLPAVHWSRNIHPQDHSVPSGFYPVLRLALAEQELDIEMAAIPRRDDSAGYIVQVQTGRRPHRPRGLSVLPPFTAVRYQEPAMVIAPRAPANLSNPIISWFAEHAAELNTSYPALFAQFRRALALVANSTFGDGQLTRAADLLNATLDRIRRSVPEAAQLRAVEVYADDDALRTWL
jgi:hypothetical protein